MCLDVVIDSFGNYFLEELSSALHKGYGSIRLGFRVVGFERFVDRDDCDLSPQMDSFGEAVSVYHGEDFGPRRVCPFQELVSDATRSGGRRICRSV